MKNIRILCIIIILIGIGLFIISAFFPAPFSNLQPWCTGMASAMIILGLGYFIDTLLSNEQDNRERRAPQRNRYPIGAKENAGYLVCKLMNILLCIYVLIINKLQTDPLILLLSIGLILIQYLLDLVLQIYYTRKNNSEGR